MDLLSKNSVIVKAEDLTDINENIKVISECKWYDKLYVIRYLMQKGYCTLFASGYSDDATALRESNVGASPNLGGTPISKNSSDIILTDDSFGGNVKAVLWSRDVIQRFNRGVLFHISTLYSIVFYAILMEFLGVKLNYTTNQILYFMLIMYSPLAFMLQNNNSSKICKPIHKSKNFGITPKELKVNIWINFIVTIAGLIIILLVNQNLETYKLITKNLTFFKFIPLAPTNESMEAILFTVFSSFIIWNVFNSCEYGTKSSLAGIFKNIRLLAGIFCGFVLNFIIIQVGENIITTNGIGIKLWILCVFYAFGLVILSEIIKIAWKILKTLRA
jgi:Ca2+-transporting ATPase